MIVPRYRLRLLRQERNELKDQPHTTRTKFGGHMKSQSLQSISAWLLAVPAFPLTAAAQDSQQRTAPPTRYTVTDLGTLPGGNFSQPFFIKRYGLVSGSSSLPDGTQEINDNGEVVGG